VTSSGGKSEAKAASSLKALLGSAVEGPTTLLFGGLPNADGTAEYRSVQISKELAKDLTALVNVWSRRAQRRSKSVGLREYDCAPQPEGHQKIQYIAIDDDTHIQRALSSVTPSTDVPVWSPKDDKVGKPRSFVVSATVKGTGNARFFGRITKGKQLVGPGRVVAFFEGNRFQSLVEQQVILVDASFDCVEFGGFLFIWKPNGFESLFAYEVSLSARARSAVNGLEPYLYPETFVTLKSAIAANRHVLRQIAGRIRLDLKTADPEKVRVAIARCGLNVSIDISDGKMRLGFQGNDPQDLITLLTERTVEAMVSGRPFIATSLEPVRS